ncbi:MULTISPECIES: hypothetical protein [Streptomyces]|uniref:hypothetical protein n=1 Tax=Streptomyces TaxID=1883 RepID=UPI002FDC67C3
MAELLYAASASGSLDMLREPTTVEALAENSGVSTERARRVIEVFLAAAVVRSPEGSSPAYVLAPKFAALHPSPAGMRPATRSTTSPRLATASARPSRRAHGTTGSKTH